MFDFKSIFQSGLPFEAFLAKYGGETDKSRWQSVLDRILLDPAQRQLLSGFRRRMNVLCMAGAWCGDCASQCPILQRIAMSCAVIDLRFVDRESEPGLADELLLCGAPRIPQVVFLDEDGKHVGRYGDRTLAAYRQLHSELCGGGERESVESPGAAITQDWLDEFERIQWLLRTSPRLRQRHGD